MTTEENKQPCHECGSRRRMPFLIFALLFVVVALIFRKPITRRLSERALLSNDAPSDEMVQQGIHDASDPQAFVLAEWNTGKIVPRELAIRYAFSLSPVGQPIPPAMRGAMVAGALDPDENVREVALGALSEHHDSALAGAASAALADIDPQIRHLGLQSLRRAPAKIGMPLAAPLLDDPDPRVAGEVLSVMNVWSGEDFGVKLREIPQSDDPTADQIKTPPEGILKLRAGIKHAKAWLLEYPIQMASAPTDASGINSAPRQPLPAPDFSMRSLDGHTVRLSDFRGKVVVLNFWTTWCTACIGETPELIKLQKLHTNDVVVLGTSLDFTPDEDDADKSATPDSIKAKVARVARQRGMNYTVLLDETGSTGAKYNGGELPTTIIVDANGYVRRRFVGTRNLAVFEALIAAAKRPL